MIRLMATATAVLGVCCWAVAVRAADGPRPSPSQDWSDGGQWPKDRVELVTGRVCQGLIESDDDNWLCLAEIRQPRGRPMYLVIQTIERSAIARVDRLDPGPRAQLKQRIEQYINRARIEQGRMEAVRLAVVERDNTRYQAYSGKWFDLESSTDEETTRRIIVRVEQVFTAYRQVLPPRTEPKRRLRLLVFGSMGAYEDHLRGAGLAIGNPAAFVEKDNLVVAGGNLGRFAAQLAQVSAQNAEVRAQLVQIKAELPRRLEEVGKKLAAQNLPRDRIAWLLIKERAQADEEIRKKEMEIRQFNRQIKQVFDQATQQMFARLYHEAFHAYLENYVFPSDTHDVPAWLNEGLAMVFEGAILESDTLRIDAPNEAALRLLKEDVRRGRHLPLAELLASERKDYLQQAGAPSGQPDRLYCHAWGLAYYLAFEKHLLAKPALTDYVRPPLPGQTPADRFERLTGTSLKRLQADWHEYVLRLR